MLKPCIRTITAIGDLPAIPVDSTFDANVPSSQPGGGSPSKRIENVLVHSGRGLHSDRLIESVVDVSAAATAVDLNTWPSASYVKLCEKVSLTRLPAAS